MKRKDLIAFIEANPGAVSKDVSAAFGESMSSATASLFYAHNRGYLTRSVVGRTLTNAPIYGYRTVGNVEGKPKKERLEIVAQTTTEMVSNTSLDSLVEQLAEAFAQQVASQVISKVKDAIAGQVKNLIPKLPAPKPVVTAHHNPIEIAAPDFNKRHIIIVGLHNHLHDLLYKEFQDSFDMVVFNPDVNLHQLQSAVINADRVFVMRDNISHKITDSLKSKGANISLVAGGTSSLCDALTNYYVKEEA